MTQADRAPARRRSLDSPPTGGQARSPETSLPPVPVYQRKPSRRLSPAEMRKIQAEYDPKALKHTRRGHDWPPCQCDNPRCPDRRVHHGAA